MKRKNATRSALFSSVIALMLCVSMLVGTTFAWFTDSVTSAGNIIKSGSLEVTMEWKDATATGAQKTYKDASEGAIFDYDLWEPGYVEAKNVKIANVGTLALKYQLNIIATGTVTKLADVIDVYYAEGEYTLAGREMTELTHIGTLTEVLAKIGTSAAGDLKATESDTVTIALKMQESAGNDYQDLSIGSKFAVQLEATQKMHENDSFGSDYDGPASDWNGSTGEVPEADAEGVITITTGAELAAFAAEVNGGNSYSGKTVKLGADINLGNVTWTPIGQNGDKAGFQGTFDGQGHTIYNLFVNQTSRAYQSAGLFGSARYATIKNFKIVNATINNLDDAGNTSNGAAVVVGAAQFATTIDNVDVENANVTGNRRVAAIAGYYVGTITNCDVKNVNLTANFDELSDGSYDNADKAGMIIAYSNGASTITNNTVTGGSINAYRDMGGIAGYATSSTLTGNKVSDLTIVVNTAHNYKSYTDLDAHDAGEIIGEGTADATNVATNVTILNGIADGLSKNDDGSYNVSNANGLATLNTMMRDGSAGKNAVINLTNDIDFTGKTWTPVDAHYEFKFSLKEFNGNGHTISNFAVNGQAMFTRFVSTSDITIKDVTFDKAAVTHSGINTALIVGHTYTNLTLDNVDVKNSAVTGGYKVATLAGTVYNEDASSTVTLTVKNCDVDACTVTTTSYDFMTCGMVAFVYEGNADKVVFENSTISNVTLANTNSGGYNYHAFVYYNDQDTNDCFNEADGVTVTNCTFVSK